MRSIVRTILVGGTLITPDHLLREYELVIEDGKITAILSAGQAGRDHDDIRIEVKGLWVTPGLIDIHTHGGAGADTMDASTEALDAMGRFFASHGVTSYLPTTVTASGEAISAAIENENRMAVAGGAHSLGLHLEGPYLNARHKGAQPEEHLRLPDPGEYRPWFDSGRIRLMTVAPELESGMDLIREGVRSGVEFAVGHSGASYEQVQMAAGYGLRHATHTFNGMSGLHHREPGTVGGVLADGRIYAQIIADGIHLHPAIVKLIVRAKGVQRSILITDSIRATGLEDGEYDLGGQTVRVREGVARVASGSLAGSTLTMEAAIRNTMAFTGASIQEAVAMATRVPAEALGISNRKGCLRPGMDADISIFDEEMNVRLTMVLGQPVYEKL
jgi:N-acetylglucosamine-6-phosphate deacetylase